MKRKELTDAQRIDWLERMAQKPEGLLLHSKFSPTGQLGLGLSFPTRTLREAIDQAADLRGDSPRHGDSHE